MKTILTDMDSKELVITNDDFDVVGWVELRIGKEVFDVHITDLLPAITGFHLKYLEEKRNYEDQK